MDSAAIMAPRYPAAGRAAALGGAEVTAAGLPDEVEAGVEAVSLAPELTGTEAEELTRGVLEIGEGVQAGVEATLVLGWGTGTVLMDHEDQAGVEELWTGDEPHGMVEEEEELMAVEEVADMDHGGQGVDEATGATDEGAGAAQLESAMS